MCPAPQIGPLPLPAPPVTKTLPHSSLVRTFMKYLQEASGPHWFKDSVENDGINCQGDLNI